MRLVILTALPSLLLAGDGAAGESTRASVSCGAPNHGALAHPAALPVRGGGFRIPEPWRARDLRYGTDELVALLRRAAARVAREHPDGVLGVADMTGPRGGPTLRHESHQSGRDVDLHFYAVDADGDPIAPDGHLPWYESDGRATTARAPAQTRIDTRWFDLARNWALVRALLEDGTARVRWIFVSARVERWLLAYARITGEPDRVVRRAARVLAEPSDSSSHNDHFHLRIACAADDVALGNCLDDPAPETSGAIRCPVAYRRVVLPD